MNHLTAADWGVILVYLTGIVLLGIRLGRGQQSTRDYFLGGRNLSWWAVGLSIVATETSAITFISIPAIAYGRDGNLTLLQIIMGYVIARLILAAVMVPHYFRGELYSPYELMGRAFGPAARRLASVFFLVAGTLAAGVRVYVTCIPVELMLRDWLSGWFQDPILGAILLFVALSLVYTLVGGIRAVVWTDAIQFILLLGGGLFLLFHLPGLVEGGWAGAMEAAGEAGKLDWFDAGTNLSLPPYTIWMGLLGATCMVLATHGVDQLIVQRVLTCRSVRDGRRALVLSAVIIFPLFLLFLLVGILLWAYHAQVPPAIPLPASQAGFQQNDYALPIFILTTAPPVVKGFLIVGILSAAMSSVSSALSALASVSVMDLLKEALGSHRSERFFLGWSRWATAFWGGLLVLVALGSRGERYVLDWAFSLNGLTNGAMLGGVGLALFWRQGRAGPVMAGMIVSFAAMLLLSQASWEGMPEDPPAVRKLGWPWFTLIGTTLTVTTALLLERLRRRGAGVRR